MAPPSPTPGAAAPGQPRLLRSVWRWHFYAGLLSIPVIVLLCISGIVYLFKPQIDALAYGGMRSVTPQTELTTFGQQTKAVEAAYPGSSITGLAPAPSAKRATEFDVLTKEGATKRVYVNPYTAQITGDRTPAKSFTTLALDLHGTLLASRFMDAEGKWGDRLIELVASWAVVLVISGMYLWWPRGRRGLRDALRPRMGAKGRTKWRDLHAITGVTFGFVTLFFLITGLAWSGVWGSKFSELAAKTGQQYPAGLYDGASSKTVGDTVKNGKAAWAAAELPLAGSPGGIPEAGGRPGHTGHAGHMHTRTITWDPAQGAPIDAIVGRAKQQGFPAGFTIAYPENEQGSYTVTKFADSDVQPNATAGSERVMYIDQYTALPIRDHQFAQFGAIGKATDFGIALHEGRQWGIWSQLFSLLGALALLFSCASAVVMWRKRKPKGIGSPRRAPDRKLGIGVVAITLGLGLLFPLLGLSILALLVFDFVLVRHIPPLGRALGAR